MRRARQALKRPLKEAYKRAQLSTSLCTCLVVAQERAKHEAAERESLSKELAASKNVNALVEKQKHDAVRAGWGCVAGPV